MRALLRCTCFWRRAPSSRERTANTQLMGTMPDGEGVVWYATALEAREGLRPSWFDSSPLRHAGKVLLAAHLASTQADGVRFSVPAPTRSRALDDSLHSGVRLLVRFQSPRPSHGSPTGRRRRFQVPNSVSSNLTRGTMPWKRRR